MVILERLLEVTSWVNSIHPRAAAFRWIRRARVRVFLLGDYLPGDPHCRPGPASGDADVRALSAFRRRNDDRRETSGRVYSTRARTLGLGALWSFDDRSGNRC